MTSNEYKNPKRSVYDTCDPQYLRGLREAANVDILVLARTACLSVAQVRQLESDDSDGLFYSDAIKRQAYKRLLMILGAEPPSVEVPEDLRDAAKVAEAHLNTLDQIVAMSQQPTINRSTFDELSALFAKLKRHKQFIGALLLLVVAVVVFSLYGPKRIEDASLLASSSSSSSSSSAESTPVLPASTPAISEMAVVTSTPEPIRAASAVSASSTVAVASSPSTTCAFADEVMPELTPFIAQKEGRYVYVVSTSNVDICVVDGNKQATVLQMKAGENRSVYGVSPWQVSSSHLSKVQIYFQGGRVSLPDAATRVKLLEVPVAR